MDTAIPIVVHPVEGDGIHEPAGAYVEAFWLPTGGPTATWMYRRLASVTAREQGPVAFDIAELAAQLGVAPAAVRRTLDRLVRFELVHQWSLNTFAVPTRAPRLKAGQIRHLIPTLQEMHVEFERQEVPA